ncbi:hypothetical protein GALMADRAFT_835169 [Galerina marginata CBS 339.88]|uniref:Phosphoglycerate mutase-like protein n=1 Tax=Galerina marginata (strain CBS 339.88) TaxID=685588 RepID=A0A067TUG7_GALM3|nr:hypothetical protein GALMADRAFT_835169 [Galerina marginata CBS 339.88]
MAADPNSKVLGVVLLVRHGDREGFYQDPVTYSPSNTAITPLGNLESLRLGQRIRSIYLDASSPDVISSVDADIVQDAQVQVRADGGGERGVIFNSAVSLLQGLWPGTPNYTTTLANGSTITGPLGGYQTVPIESVEPDNDVSLEGFTDCNTFVTATNAFYNSALFNATAAAHADFIKSLPPFLDGRPATLVNMWNIYDFMNVQNIHNATFAKALPAGYIEQARDLANFHEHGVFTSPQLGGIGNIAGQTILPSILNGFANITDPTSTRKLVLEAISYKPFLSLFNMTGVAQMNPQLAGIVEYSAAAAFEVRQPSGGGEPVLRFKFKNGTLDDFHTYNFMNSTTDVPISTFVNTLKSVAFADTPTWCHTCNNNQDRGCAAIVSSTPNAVALVHHDRVSPVGSGFIGACVTLVIMLGVLGMLSFLGLLTFGRKSARRSMNDNDSDQEKK